MRGFKDSETEIYDAIVEMWKNQGWAWDSHAAEGAKRICRFLPIMLSQELEEIRKTIKVVSETLGSIGFETVRARDAYLLYERLKKTGASEETASYALYAFLRGEGENKVMPEPHCENPCEIPFPGITKREKPL